MKLKTGQDANWRPIESGILVKFLGRGTIGPRIPAALWNLERRQSEIAEKH